MAKNKNKKTAREMATEILELPFDMIGSNGGEIIKGGKLIKHSYLPNDTVANICEYLEENNYLYAIHTHEGKYVIDNVDFITPILEICKANNNSYDSVFDTFNKYCNHIYLSAKRTESYKTLLSLDDIMINKIEVYYQGEKESLCSHLNDTFEVNSFSSMKVNVEIIPSDVNKAVAIKEYIGNEDYYVIAIGDGDNDIPMFEVADYKIAMGNATESLKQISDVVVNDVDKGGYLEALNLIENLTIKQ